MRRRDSRERGRECGWLFESFRDKGDRTHGQIADFKGGGRIRGLANCMKCSMVPTDLPFDISVLNMNFDSFLK